MLPNGTQINMLIPSDVNLYARVSEAGGSSIHELSSQDGSVLRRFQVGKNESGAAVACVNDGKFISFREVEGRLVPLSGIPELVSDPVQPKPNASSTLAK